MVLRTQDPPKSEQLHVEHLDKGESLNRQEEHEARNINLNYLNCMWLGYIFQFLSLKRMVNASFYLRKTFCN